MKPILLFGLFVHFSVLDASASKGPFLKRECTLLGRHLSQISRFPSGYPRTRHAVKVSAAAAATAMVTLSATVYFSTEATTAVTADHAHLANDEKDKLLHISFIGDSLSKNFYLSSIPSTAWRIRTENQRNMVLDVDSTSHSVRSLFERVSEHTPLVMTEYSKPGAKVIGPKEKDLADWILKIDHFEHQVAAVVQQKRFPDLVLIWIGHNEVDWVEKLQLGIGENRNETFRLTRQHFVKTFEEQLGKLSERAEREKRHATIIVFGLINFDSFFNAREKCEEAKSADSTRYPYLEACYNQFESMKPEYRDGMIELSTLINQDLNALVNRLSDNRQSTVTEIVYSDALSTADISDPIVLNEMDAWHPSIVGHTRLSEVMYNAISPIIQSLESKRQPVRSDPSP